MSFPRAGKAPRSTSWSKSLMHAGDGHRTTEAPNSPLGKMSDLVLRLHDIGREDPFGYIATSSSLVNAAMGDALCVLLLEARGYTLVAFGQTHPRVQWVVA